jgi:L-lysine exporter family protein LysE/ArgO
MSPSVYLTGLMAGLSLIVAIGAQNAFVLRQGLMDKHVFAVSLACSVSDAALIALGVTSFRQIAVVAPWAVPPYDQLRPLPPETPAPPASRGLWRCASR